MRLTERIFKHSFITLVFGSLLHFMMVVLPASAEYHQTIATEPGVSIEVSSFLANAPHFGTIPIQVRIANDTDQTLEWNFRAQSSSYRAAEFKISKQLRVPAGKTKNFSIIVDVFQTGTSNNYYQNVWYRISGPRVGNDAGSVTLTIPSVGSINYSVPKKVYTPITIFSRDLSPFSEYLKSILKTPEYSYGRKKKQPESIDTSWMGASQMFVYRGNIAPIELFPADWRGYLAAQQIWISKSEFSSLAAAQRAALLSWVQQGGVLIRAGSEVSFFEQELYLKSTNKRHFYQKFGLGVIVEVPFASGSMVLADFNEWLDFTQNQQMPLLAAEKTGNRANWGLQKPIDQSAVLAGPVAIILLIYSILVAPVAILWIAVANKRPASLYISVPLLSMSTALILILTLIFQYGVGAAGARQLAVILSPEERQILVVQEQSTINGVLFGSSFNLENSVAIRPISMGKRARDREGQVMQSRNEKYAGDYFRERTQTAHVLQQVRPTRARIDLLSGKNGPVLASSLPITLSKVFYIDDTGDVWFGDELREGSQLALVKGNQRKLNDWKYAAQRNGSEAIEPIISKIAERPGYFYALSDDANIYSIDTLDSVRWGTAPALVAGPVRKGGGDY